MNTQRLLFSSTAALLTGVTVGAAHAQPLTFQDTPAAVAAAQIGARYGVGVELKGLGGVRVSFTVDDADAPDGRLQAVNALANAAGADFTKTYVVESGGPADAAPARIDVTTSLPSSQKAYPAQEAIAMVAGLDDADVRFADAVAGTVTLPGPSLSVGKAAAEIARQTGTRWRTVYALASRLSGRSVGGTVIGRTGGGSAIIELACVYYHDAAWSAHQARVEEAERQQALAEQQAVQAEQAAQQAALAQQAAGNGQRVGNGGYSPTGYGPNGSGYGGQGGGNGPIVIGGQSGGNNFPTAGGY